MLKVATFFLALASPAFGQAASQLPQGLAVEAGQEHLRETQIGERTKYNIWAKITSGVDVTPSMVVDDYQELDAKSNPDQTKVENNHVDPNIFLDKTLRDPVAFYTALLTAFTACLAISTVLLWRATRDLVRSAEETAERQLRAYLFVELGLPNGNAGRKVDTISIRVTNAGLTPASHVGGWACLKLHPGAFAQDSVVMNDSSSEIGFIVNPRNSIVFMDIGLDQQDAKELHIQLNNPEYFALFLYGCIRYRDAFYKSRSVTFKLQCRSSDWQNPKNFDPCEKGNQAT